MEDNRVFYGPHPCADCGVMIVKASHEQGGEKFDAPCEPIYPNTVWHRHNCGPMHVRAAQRAWDAIADTSALSNGETFPRVAPVTGEPAPLHAMEGEFVGRRPADRYR